ncbi:MAG: alpha/beta hydrolase [Longimonas sp.]|uniref:alpha/beta hydrolase n=1 Tax=Longimonas sp. TaxID=2039626 RepID=UPI00335D9A97
MASSSFPRWLRWTTAGAASAALAISAYHRSLPPPHTLDPALNANTRILESSQGRLHLYHRPGTGTPLVFLHSFNAVASPMEMRPLFEHYAAATDRPLWALDWLGFGRSERADRSYDPSVYQDVLYDVLTDAVKAPADLVACSLGSEFAAAVALQAATQVRRCALIAPTGLSANRGPSPFGRLAVKTAASIGGFTGPYFWLTRPKSLRRYLAAQVFLDDEVPEALVRYGAQTARIHGAPYAPRHFVDGSLFQRDIDTEVYARLYRPTLILTPQTPDTTVQRFDRLSALLKKNPRYLQHADVPGGLLPHWERPEPTLNALDAFLLADHD